MSGTSDLPITIEFSGGAELLFDNKRHHNITLPHKSEWKLGDLLVWIKDNLLKERPDLFIQNNSIRPGILILVNDSDWELLDTINYIIQPEDKIVFISTLHGG